MRVTARQVAYALLFAFGCRDARESGSNPTALSPSGARHLTPQYSPDGKRIAWWAPATDSVGGWELWVGNSDLTGSVRLPVINSYPALTFWSPDGSAIATTSNQFGTAHGVVVPVSGGTAKRITTGRGVDYPTAWFPDGDRVAYYASAEGGTFTSFVASTRTGVSVAAIPGEKRPYFAVPSPTGSHIAFNVFDGSRATVWVADSAGDNPRQLTTEGFERLAFGSPWSPDGKELLFDSYRTGNADIWVVPIAGGGARQLTRDVRHDRTGSWSGDGKWIAFISQRGKQTDVWVVPSMGGQERRITETPAQEYWPLVWRPGTKELSFVVEDVKSAIWALDLDGGTERRLTSDSLRTGGFYVSPDGREMLYLLIRSGGIHDLMAMPISGGASRVVLAGGGTVSQPRWSPDGSKISFLSDRGGTSDVWVVDAAGGAPRQLVDWPSSEYSARWSRDGSAVYFISDRDARVGDVWKAPIAGGAPTRVTNNGSVGNSIVTRDGVSDIFAGTVNPVGGQLSYSRIRPDGTMNSVWERSNAFVNFVSPSGDSLAASVEQPDGKMRSMIISASGGGGRVILKPGENIQWWSADGSQIVYDFYVGGARDLGVLRLTDGTTRRLTTTPETEAGAEMTPDGKTLVFIRSKWVQRIYSTDLSRLLAEGN